MKQDRITNREVLGRDQVLANGRVMPSAKWAKPSAPPPKPVATNNKTEKK